MPRAHLHLIQCKGLPGPLMSRTFSALWAARQEAGSLGAERQPLHPSAPLQPVQTPRAPGQDHQGKGRARCSLQPANRGATCGTLRREAEGTALPHVHHLKSGQTKAFSRKLQGHRGEGAGRWSGETLKQDLETRLQAWVRARSGTETGCRSTQSPSPTGLRLWVGVRLQTTGASGAGLWEVTLGRDHGVRYPSPHPGAAPDGLSLGEDHRGFPGGEGSEEGWGSPACPGAQGRQVALRRQRRQGSLQSCVCAQGRGPQDPHAGGAGLSQPRQAVSACV